MQRGTFETVEKELSFLTYITDNAYEYTDIPTITIGSNDDTEKWLKTHKKIIVTYIKRMSNYALIEGLLKVPIFKLYFTEISGQIVTIILERNNIDIALLYCVEYHQELEEYEECAELMKIINDR